MTRSGRNRRLLARTCAGLVAGFLFVGCSDSAVPALGFAHPTLIEVSPEAFLGSVPCMDAPGAMRRYVATVFDVTARGNGESSGGAGGEGPEASDFALPSSTVARGDGLATPTPCTQSVGFSRIVARHKYRAEVDGYDRDDLVALAPGLRILVDPQTSERVAPRWTTSCGAEHPVEGTTGVTRTVGNCKALADSGTPGETRVEVRIDDVLGTLACGAGEGELERFEVFPPDAAPVGAACGESVTLPAGDARRATLTLPVRAFSAGATEPAWGTSCVARVISGITTTATCLPLSSTGALEVDPLDALEALGLECDASAFEELDVEVEGQPVRHVPPSACARPLEFAGLEPGSATARVTARFADGSRSDAARCTGAVVPGDTARAACAAP